MTEKKVAAPAQKVELCMRLLQSVPEIDSKSNFGSAYTASTEHVNHDLQTRRRWDPLTRAGGSEFLQRCSSEMFRGDPSGHRRRSSWRFPIISRENRGARALSRVELSLCQGSEAQAGEAKALGMRNPDVDAWFEAKQHPMKEAMQVVRRVTLEADPRITESIKWSTPSLFGFSGNIFSFNPAKKFVSLLFHTGAQIPGDHPALEGDPGTAGLLRFSDVADVEHRSGELVEVLRSWCEWKGAPPS